MVVSCLTDFIDHVMLVDYRLEYSNRMGGDWTRGSMSLPRLLDRKTCTLLYLRYLIITCDLLIGTEKVS